MRILAAVLLALAPLAAAAQTSNSCDLAGTYELDRKPIHDDILASMTASLDELGDRPDEGSFAVVEWDARRNAYQKVMAEARAGEIVPYMTLELEPDGSLEYRVLREGDDTPRNRGRWTADSACRTLVVDLYNDDQEEPSIVRVEGNRLVFAKATGNRRGALNGVSFDRIRR